MTERERPLPDGTPGGPAAPAAPPTYTSGERVFGPPQGTFDLEWAARLVAERLPDLGWDASWRLAVRAWEGLRATGGLDAEVLARHLAGTGPAAPGEAERVAARIAVDLATAYGVDPAG